MDMQPELLASTKILIVDDDRFQRMVIRQIMANCGFINIKEAEDGEEGLQKAIEWKPTLLFLDVNMPKLNGLAVSRALHKKKLHNDIIIIIQTAFEEAEFKAEAFDAGVTDFITKPLNAHEITARVLAHLERKILKDALDRDYKNLRDELHEATTLQQILLPQKEVLDDIRKTQKIDIAQYYKPSSQLGGDYLAVHKLSGSRTMLLNADISGHGITASLYTFALHTIIESLLLKELSPGEMLEEINNRLFSLIARGKFLTIFLAIIDTDNNSIEYAAAAAPEPLLFSNGKVIKLGTKGFLIGTQKNIKYKTCTQSFNKGDVLCLYSDAMIETPDKNGLMLSEDDLAGKVSKLVSKKSSAILDSTLKQFFDEYSQTPSDDLSLMVFKYM